MEKKKIIVYIDGFNFYHGLKDRGWRNYYWLDIVGFFDHFMKPDQELVAVKYFSARSLEQDKAQRQASFFSANKLNPRFQLHLGKYTSKEVVCFNCKHKYQRHEEKRTDVAIATQLVRDIVLEECDISILVSADSDLIPPIEVIRELKSNHPIYVYFPPKRRSTDLQSICDNKIDLDRYESRFKKCVMPDQVTLPNGHILQRPKHWHTA